MAQWVAWMCAWLCNVLVSAVAAVQDRLGLGRVERRGKVERSETLLLTY